MLPGLRFLFAAIVFSMSILIFGLGAVALLRTAHEEFASTPTWRAAPETVFAQPAEATRPVLALLRVDAPVTDKASEKVPDNAPADAAPTAVTSAPAEAERIATLNPEDSPPPESAKPENSGAAETTAAETTAAETTPTETRVAERPVQNEAAPPPADSPAPVAEPKAIEETKVAETENAETGIADTKIATSEEASLPASQAELPAASEPTGEQVSPEADTATTRIATLGGPAITIATPRPVKAESTKPDPNVIKKRQRARRAAERRRLAARARVTVQMQPRQVDPFGQPAPMIVRSR
jgi:hypothetical protein